MGTYNYAITNETRIKNRLGLSQTDATRDAVIKSMIYSITDFLEHSCGGRRFKRQTISNEVYDGSPLNGSVHQFIILKNAPLVEGQSITLEQKSGSYGNYSWVDITSSIKDVDYLNGIIYFTVPIGFQNIRISYTAGYLIDFDNSYTDTAHSLPYDINDLAERLIVKLFKKRDSEGRTQESFNNSSISWGALLEEHDKEIIANYTRRNFV